MMLPQGVSVRTPAYIHQPCPCKVGGIIVIKGEQLRYHNSIQHTYISRLYELSSFLILSFLL